MRLVGDFNRTFDATADFGGEENFVLAPQASQTQQPDLNDWPAEVDLILSAMEAAKPQPGDRRNRSRAQYRTRAELRLFAHSPIDPPQVLYTRDVHERGVGFITRQRLPLGYGGMITITLPTGRQITTHCTIFRCREAINGWFEGAVHFTTRQLLE